jgi:hypothetical protein
MLSPAVLEEEEDRHCDDLVIRSGGAGVKCGEDRDSISVKMTTRRAKLSTARE